MASHDLNTTVRECVSCRRCYDSVVQFCEDCFVELISIEFIPRVIGGRYRLERVTARGGMGRVFAAVDLGEPREVAVKVLRASVMAEPLAQDRFRREAGFAAALHNPQVVAVYDYGVMPDASAFVVMELVGEPSLREEMKREGRLAPARAVAVLAGAAGALHAAHKAGLVHRDLKPESIALLQPSDGQPPGVKLLGFSFARVASGQLFIPGTTARLQARGYLPRTPTYLSPEQFRGEEVDLRADVYSLGVIAYEALAGKPPFAAQRVGDFGFKLLNETAQPLRALNPKVSPLLEAVIARALEKDPAGRQQNAAEFKRELLGAAQVG